MICHRAVPDWKARGIATTGRACWSTTGLAGVHGHLRALRGRARINASSTWGPATRTTCPWPCRAAAVGVPRYFTPGGLPAGCSSAADLDEACSRSGTPISTSVPSAGAARFSAHMASTPPRSPWQHREVMSAMGVATKYVTEVVAKVYERATTWAFRRQPGWTTASFSRRNCRKRPASRQLPVDDDGADVLLVPPSADNFANTDTMIGYAKLFHVLGVRWTTSTYCNEGGNFRAVPELRQHAEGQQSHHRGSPHAGREDDYVGRVRSRLAGGHLHAAFNGPWTSSTRPIHTTSASSSSI